MNLKSTLAAISVVLVFVFASASVATEFDGPWNNGRYLLGGPNGFFVIDTRSGEVPYLTDVWADMNRTSPDKLKKSSGQLKADEQAEEFISEEDIVSVTPLDPETARKLMPQLDK